VARPIGGIVFGHYGDKVGRKNVLVVTLLVMGIATFLIGLLPTYAAIGVAAPILLVVLRIAQGLGLGGEWGGAVLMSLEHGQPDRCGWNASWPQVGVPAGNLLAAAVLGLMSAILSDAAFESWGWRVPFLLSGALIAVGLGPLQRGLARLPDRRRARRRPGPDHLHRPAGPVRLPPARLLYVLAGLLVTIVSVWLAPETARIDLHQERPDERRIVQDPSRLKGSVLRFTAYEWEAFLGGARDGEFELKRLQQSAGSTVTPSVGRHP
jgi:MFS family permease